VAAFRWRVGGGFSGFSGFSGGGGGQRRVKGSKLRIRVKLTWGNCQLV